MNDGETKNARKETKTMTNQNNNPKPTAIETYRKRRGDVARLLDILSMELDKFSDRAEAEPKNWSPAGTMDFVRSSLIDLVEGLSGIDRELIEETLAE